MPPVKVKFLSRGDIRPRLVTDADAFTVLRYLRHRESVPALPETEDKGRETLPGIEAALADVYHALWDPEPGVRDEVSPDRRYWRELLSGAINSSAYQELHAATQLKELQSILGTIAMGESVIAMVPKKDQEQLRQLAKASAEANEAQQQAQQAQAEAQMLQQLAEAAQAQAQQAAAGMGQSSDQTGGQPQPGLGQLASGQVQPSGGQPQGQPSGGSGQLTPERAKAIANELAEQTAKAQQDAQAAQELAAEAKDKAEALADNLLGKGTPEAQQKLDELRRMGLAAARAAQAKIEEVSETIEAWGLEPAELHRQGIPESLGLLERMKRSEALRKFSALLGRIRKIAARKARSRTQGEGARIITVEYGRDLKRAHRSELVELVSPALRVKALQRWTRGELRQSGQQTRQKLGYGPVVVCEDASGSMDGTKQKWAKAVVLSLAHYAKLQRRSFGWIMFDARVQRAKTYPQGRLSAEQLLELVEARAGGGTDFERPLRSALEMIQKAGLKKADICLITDGECAVSDAFLKEFLAAKKSLEINVFTVLCDVGLTSDATVKSFSDRVEKVSAFTAEEAETKLFRHL